MGIQRLSAASAFTLLCAAAALTLTGCGVNSGPENKTEPADAQTNSTVDQPAPEPAKEPEPVKPEPEPKPAKFVIPTACDAMNSTAYDEAIANLGEQARSENTDLQRFEVVAGSVAKETMTKAIRVEGCYYPVYFHNAVYQYIAEVPAADQNALIAALRDDPTITEKSSGVMLHFSFPQHMEGPNGSTMSTNVNYLFTGDAWIAMFDNGELDYVPAAIEGLRAANPGL